MTKCSQEGSFLEQRYVDVSCAPGFARSTYKSKEGVNVVCVYTWPPRERAAITPVADGRELGRVLDPASQAGAGVARRRMRPRHDYGGFRQAPESGAGLRHREGRANRDELASIADAWRTWAKADDGWFAVLHAERHLHAVTRTHVEHSGLLATGRLLIPHTTHLGTINSIGEAVTGDAARVWRCMKRGSIEMRGTEVVQ